MIRLDESHLNKPVNYKKYAKKVEKLDAAMNVGIAAGSDFLGWKDLPSNTKEEDLNKIVETAEYIRKNFDVLVVCGIGGSYLGTRAAVEAINGLKSQSKPEIVFVGQTFSSDYIHECLEYLKGKKFAINVISKSGTTTETAISFRLFKALLEEQVGKEKARKAIFATTDEHKGALRTMCEKEGYVSFPLPGNVGGRYSVLTAVGLLPIACAGIDIKKIIEGAREAEKDFSIPDITKNIAYQYAAIRHMQYKQGKNVELFVSYEPRLVQLAEWFKQLFAESEGKEHKGLLPYGLSFSTDLHSIGQFVQEGKQTFFETVLNIKNSNHEVVIPTDEENLDELNYLAGKNLNFVNQQAFKGVLKAHAEEAGVPNLILEVEKLDEYTLGYLFYFFEKTCAMSGYLLGVNPFNQPGVEVYKRNMFHLLGKKGY